MNRGFSTLVLVVCGAALLAVTGCQQIRKGSVVLVEQSGSKPDWIETRPQGDDPVLFVGEVTNAKDLSLATEEAEYDAIKRLAGRIGQEINGEFSSMIKGSNRAESAARLGTTVESVINARINDVKVRGTQPVQRYWAKYETAGEDGTVMTTYRVDMLVKISKADYEHSKLELVNQAAEAQQIRADGEAKAALEEFKARLQKK